MVIYEKSQLYEFLSGFERSKQVLEQADAIDAYLLYTQSEGDSVQVYMSTKFQEYLIPAN